MTAKEVLMVHPDYLRKKVEEDILVITATQEECEFLNKSRWFQEIKDRVRFSISNN